MDELILLLPAGGAYNQLALVKKELDTAGIPAVIYMGEKCHNYQELYQSFKKIRETEWFHFYMDFTGKIVKCGEAAFYREQRKNFLLDSVIVKQWLHERTGKR